MSGEESLSFPRQSARTRRFTLGRPRAGAASPDGRRVVFLRSAGGQDPVTSLWVLDLPAAQDDPGVLPRERCVLDPREVLGAVADEEDLPPEERARRERLRETSGGVVSRSLDTDVTAAAAVLSGRVFVVGLLPGDPPAREVPLPGPAVDPRLSPDGTRVAVVIDGALHVAPVRGDPVRGDPVRGDPDDRGLVGAAVRVAGEDAPDVTWGLAEFVAAEEMGRTRGHWWAPGSDRLLVARADVAAVQRWWVGDPAEPASRPQELRYPAAGTADAEVSLHLVDADGVAPSVRVSLDPAWPYVARAGWDADHGPTLLVQSRDQRTARVLVVDPTDGTTTVRREQTDEHWVDLVDGSPAWCGDLLVTTVDEPGTRRLRVGDDVVTPPGLQVRAVLHADAHQVLVSASSEPTEVHVHRWAPGEGLEQVSQGAGVHSASARGDVVVLTSAVKRALRPTTRALRRGRSEAGSEGGPAAFRELATLEDRSEVPAVDPRPETAVVGERHLRTVLLLPPGRATGDGGPALPVLLDPYGGPHAQRVLATRMALLGSQWFADQGFAVLVADGRGTPGRGPAWEREVAGDLATAPLADQLDALDGVAALHRGLLDLDRVGIRGWSFGGYLAALAVLRAPGRVHAAVAGAPVTDWSLYDTHYTERYLGTPSEQPDVYARSSLLADAPLLRRPLMLVHGLADDNVVAAHALRLSGALLAAGRPHELLPLAGVTHVASQEDVAENLLLLQVEFLRRALGGRA